MLVTIGNFFFHYRNFLFPFALLFVLVGGPTMFENPMDAVVLGFIVAGFGQLVRGTTIGFRYIIRGGKDRRVYAQDLITEGIYSHSRNPMYVGNVLILCGVALGCNTWACLLLAVPFCVFIYVAIIAAEEAYLRDKFGSAFDAYCNDVPRWLPRLKGLGATLHSMKFNWSRVIIKEYGTPFGLVTGLCIIGIVHLWRDSRLDISDSDLADCALIIVWIAVFFFWITARVLKKTKTLVAD
jgi:protein-S-isoprenylcysteine O-methyltransferase Ste14